MKRRISLFALVLTVAATAAPAQTSPTSTASPAPVQTVEQKTTGEQKPAADAQVHTGTSTGQNDAALDADALRLLGDHQFGKLAALAEKLPDGDLYRGLIANRSNDLARSIELLEPLVDPLSTGNDRTKEKLVRKALAEDYLRRGEWSKAQAAYEQLSARLDKTLTDDERDEIELPLKLLPLAAGAPPMTIEASDPFQLQVTRNPLGLVDVPVFVDARPHTWMLDATAPFNLMARSIAREIGLKVSEAAVTVHSLTGKPITMHTALVPRLTIGGRLTLRNLTVFVFEDQDYHFKDSNYQVQGTLGYPALMALGALTITNQDTIRVEPARTTDDAHMAAHGVPFYLDGDQLVVALGKAGEERMVVIDGSSQQTYLTSRFYLEHADLFNGQKMQLFEVPGFDKLPPQPAYLAETIGLTIDHVSAPLHYIQVLTQPLGSAAVDDLYGVLGIDALDQLKSYTFDYRTMRFSIEAE